MDLFTIRAGKCGTLVLEFCGLFVACCVNSIELQEEQEALKNEIEQDGIEAVINRLLFLEKQRREPLPA